jgi:hypothetical protein
MRAVTDEEWKHIVNWTKRELRMVLDSYAVVEGTTPEEEEFLHLMARLRELHELARADSPGSAQTGTDLVREELTRAFWAGMAPDGHVPAPPSDYEALVEELIDRAKTDPVSFDALRHHVANLLSDGIWPVTPLRRFLDAILRDNIKPPVKRGRSKQVRACSRLIAAVTQGVVDEFGLTPMRNEKPTDEPRSACDAVAQAMVALRDQPSSYDRIRKIWVERDWK